MAVALTEYSYVFVAKQTKRFLNLEVFNNRRLMRSEEESYHEDRCFACTLFDLRTVAATPVRSKYFTCLRPFDR